MCKTLFGLWTILFSKSIKAIAYVRISREGIEDLPQVGEKSHTLCIFTSKKLLGCTVDTSTVHKSKTHYCWFLCKQ